MTMIQQPTLFSFFYRPVCAQQIIQYFLAKTSFSYFFLQLQSCFLYRDEMRLYGPPRKRGPYLLDHIKPGPRSWKQQPPRRECRGDKCWCQSAETEYNQPLTFSLTEQSSSFFFPFPRFEWRLVMAHTQKGEERKRSLWTTVTNPIRTHT